jgi:hypothetical protein
MARRVVAYGIVTLFVVFLGILLVLPYVKRMFPTVSGFSNMSCKEGAQPCPEGFFCEQTMCVPILPRYNIDNVVPS